MTFFGRTFGDVGNHTADNQAETRQTERQLAGLWTAEPVIVWDYDFENQRVDLLLRNHPGTHPIRKVPIVDSGGSVRIVRPINTMKAWLADTSLPPPDVGTVLFMRTDSMKSFTRDPSGVKSLQHHPRSNLVHKKMGAIFIPAVHMVGDALLDVMDKTAGNTNVDKAGPKDYAIAHKSGATVIIKEDGTINVIGKVLNTSLLLKADGEVAMKGAVANTGITIAADGTVTIKGTAVYIGNKDQTTANMKSAARKTDAVNDVTDEISGGSSNVYIG